MSMTTARYRITQVALTFTGAMLAVDFFGIFQHDWAVHHAGANLLYVLVRLADLIGAGLLFKAREWHALTHTRAVELSNGS